MTRILATIAILISSLRVTSAADSESNFFERKVRPLLIARCGDCHGADAPEGDLTLTSVDGISQGGSLGRVFVPGRPDTSRLTRSVRYTSKLKMPPGGKLSADEIAVLEKWVRDGAALPDGTAVPSEARSGEFEITDEDRQWWSFQPIRQPDPPNVQHDNRVRTPIDRFVLRKLEQHDLTHSPDADHRTFIRRVSFDLIGLPPTPAEIDAFLADERPDAFERLVDRLLASPHYGERWGRHWLDLARYADTNGGGFDYVYPNAWRYRDYVVRAFNQDKPFDQFLTEQLAGDLLPIDCSDEEYVDRLTATGLLTLAPKGLGMQDKEQMRLDVVDDQIDVLGRSLIGLTLSCARCHDHKFDPISTRDYYGLAGVFYSTSLLADTDKNPSYWPERPLELPSMTEARKQYQSRKAANAKAIADTTNEANAKLASRARERVADYLFAAARIHQSRDRQPAVAHWPFDGSDAQVVNAVAGPEGKLSNAGRDSGPRPARVDGSIGRALRFAGQQDVVAFTPDGTLDFGKTTDFTVAFWIRTVDGYLPATADTVLAAKYASSLWFVALRPGAYNGIYLRHYDGKRTVDIKPAKNLLPKLTDNQWHHVAFASDRDGNGSVYVDGERAGETSIASISPAADFSNLQTFSIGPSANQFRGDLDDVAIWNRLLSSGEVRQLFSPDGDSEQSLNASQVLAAKPSSTTEKSFSYKEASAQGLVPSIVKRFVDVLAKAEGEAASPFQPLTVSAVSTEDVQQVLAEKRATIDTLLDDRKGGPLVPGDNVAQFYDDNFRERLAKLSSEATDIEQTRVPDPALGMVAFDATSITDLAVHIAGDHKNQGDVVARGVPDILKRVDLRKTPAAPGTTSGRLELARWLTSRDHPLTARVFVNHVWKWHFGEGLVRTPDNFGRLGEEPSHPELLDWLARRFIDSGWSVKDLHRQIVLSAVYRQQSYRGDGLSPASQIDSGNRLLWRMNRRRLEGEALRDAMLSVSGQLDERIGGTVNAWKPKMFSVDNSNAETANYNTRRRSIYLPVVRGAALHEMLQLFDFGDPNSITARRDVTTVAPQSLFLMNSPFVLEHSQKLAERLAAYSKFSTNKRIELAWQLTLSREPTPAELQRATRLIGGSPDYGWRLVCQMLLCLNEFAYVD